MNKIFINIEGENICLYNLEISDRAKELEKQILYKGPVRPLEIVSELSHFKRGDEVGDGIISDFTSEYVGKNGVKSLYRYIYSVNQKTELYDDLFNIRLGYLEYLEDINNYYAGKNSYDNSSQLFCEFESEIREIYSLKLLLKEKNINILQLLEKIGSKSSDEYKNKIKELTKYLNIYQINLSNFDIKDFTSCYGEAIDISPIKYNGPVKRKKF